MHHSWMLSGHRLRLGWRRSVLKLMPLPRKLLWQPPLLKHHVRGSRLLLHLRLGRECLSQSLRLRLAHGCLLSVWRHWRLRVMLSVRPLRLLRLRSRMLMLCLYLYRGLRRQVGVLRESLRVMVQL